jgi:hypothetical protein
MADLCSEWIGRHPDGTPVRQCRRPARIRLTFWPGKPMEMISDYCTQHARTEYATRGALPMRWQTLKSIAAPPSPSPETEP